MPTGGAAVGADWSEVGAAPEPGPEPEPGEEVDPEPGPEPGPVAVEPVPPEDAEGVGTWVWPPELCVTGGRPLTVVVGADVHGVVWPWT